MALTKARLIADGVITVDNLHESHGITTTHIGEGNKLFYTDTRVSNYLSANNYITTSDVPNLETVTSLSISANILSYVNEAGITTNIDLSTYLDDTNLARLVSGTLNPGTGIATFTRDDSSTFTIDFSSFLADANDYVSSGEFSTATGVLTLTRLGGGTVTVDLDGKYAEASHTHLWSQITDRPTALSAFTNDLGNYGGFVEVESDPTVPSHVKSITTTNISNWNTAYGWGNHAGLYSLLGHTHDYLPIGGKAADSELLDGIDSSQFVRNDTSRSQVSNYMDIANVTSGSFRIYDGTTFRGGFGTSRWSDSVSAVDQMSIYSVGDGINFYTGNSNAIRSVINSDYLYHVSDVRSPLFYDSDNTGYYVDPASTSRINAVQFDNIGVGQSVNGSYRIITSGDIYLNANGNGWAEGTWKQRRAGSTWYDVIDSGNIGSQSVSYATSAGETGFLSALSDYVWNASTNGRSFARGIQASFVRSEVDGYPSYGSVVRVRTYTGGEDGGTAELYFPYSSTYGGSSMRYRLGQYDNAGWTGWKTVIDSDNIGSQSVNYASSANTSSTTTHYASRTDSSWYNAVWAAGNPSHLYSADSVQIQSSTGSIKANVFYDNNDTGYYLDPHATSNLNTVQVSTIRNNGNVADDDGFGIYWQDNAPTSYAIYREGGAWSHPYPDLRIAFHTGIKLGANAGYNGIRFYTDYDMATQVMSVNNGSDGYGAGHVYVNNIMHAGGSHRAPIFYDSNDTGYYVDPNSRSVISTLTANGKNHYFGTSSSWDGVGFGNLTNVHFQGHDHFWIGAGNAYWYRGGISTEHDLLITTMYGYDSNAYFRGITFAVENNGTGSSGNYRLGRWQTYNTDWRTSRLQVDASLSVGYGARGTRAYDEARYPLDRGVWPHGRNEAGYGNDRIREYLFSPTGNGGGPWGSFASLEVSSTYEGNSDIPALFRIHQWGSGAAEFWKPQGTTLYLRESPGGGGTWFTRFYIEGYAETNGSFRAPIFYDSNDTNYYIDPNADLSIKVYGEISNSNYNPGNMQPGALNIGRIDTNYNFASGSWAGDIRAGILANCLDEWEFVIHDSGTSVESVFLYQNSTGYITMGRDLGWGTSPIIAANSFRAPIFYDSNNTGYYVDPASTSNLLGLSVAGTINGNISGRSAYSGYLETAYAGGQQLNPQVYFNNGVGVKVAMTASWGYWSDTLWINGYAGGDVLQMCALHTQRNGQPRIAISAQASNGTSYGTIYELWSSYNMDAPNKSGTSYYQTNTWMQFNGFYGLYWPGQYGAHFYPNDASSYTQFRLNGSKNGYGGIYDSYSAVAGIMYDSAGNGGMYREANGRWYFYHYVGNNCTGINTSTTSASYGLYVEGAIYSTGDITAYSDVRKKTNIATIDSALDKVTKLRGVYYDRIDDLEKGRQVGVIAQEVNEVLPEAVTYAEDIDEYGVKYGNIVGVLIEAIKEQQKQIEELKAIVNGITK